MSGVSVKICGLTDEAAVRAVAAANADYAGFVYFPKSPRHITPARAAELKSLLPSSIHAVSVLVDPDDALLADIMSALEPYALQLHGKETPERVAAIKKRYPGVQLIKAIPVQTGDDIARAHSYEAADMLLFDSSPLRPPLEGGQNFRQEIRGGYQKLADHKYDEKTLQQAKNLRKHSTEAEAKLWAFLKGKKLDQYKFRRQQPIGSFIADFYCPAAKLVIEIDGSQHNEVENIEYDKSRTKFLENNGCRVLRFWNNEILQNISEVGDKILATLLTPPDLLRKSAPPQGGGETNYLPGGTGRSFDWILLKHRDFGKPWFLSGGLDADNVQEAIRLSGARMVDVSSGVESSPGKKDADRIEAFVRAAGNVTWPHPEHD